MDEYGRTIRRLASWPGSDASQSINRRSDQMEYFTVSRSLATLALFCSLCCVQPFQITVFQPHLTTLTPSKATQLELLDQAAASAARAGSNVLVVPELYLTGYNINAAFGAEVRGGPSYAAAQASAVSNNVSILFTYPEKDPVTGKLHDSAALLSRNGSSLADYRKVNLASGESIFLTAGEAFAPVVELDGVRVGVLICFDVFLPEPSRLLALQVVITLQPSSK